MKMDRLQGKTAVVTGAGRGIGKAIALALAAEGVKVAINDFGDEAPPHAVADEINKAGGEAIVVMANVADPVESRNMIKYVAEQFGHLDILVNNAGITRDKSIRKMSDEEWDTVIKVDLYAIYYTISAAVPLMINQTFGRIINISSYSGQYGNFGQSNYAAAKAGILGLSKTVALEVAKYNITVNSICPGYTATEMVAAMPANIKETLTAKIPVGRMADPSEIAWGVVFLAGDTGFVTGQEIAINGGMGM
jgi:acetoacetyl-CoA reductase